MTSLRLWLRQLDGSEFCIQSDCQTTIKELKCMIADKFATTWSDASADKIHLMHSRHELGDDETMESANLLDDTRIICTLDKGQSIPLNTPQPQDSEMNLLAGAHASASASSLKKDSFAYQRRQTDDNPIQEIDLTNDTEMYDSKEEDAKLEEGKDGSTADINGSLSTYRSHISTGFAILPEAATTLQKMAVPHPSIKGNPRKILNTSQLRKHIGNRKALNVATYWGTVHQYPIERVPNDLNRVKELVIRDDGRGECSQSFGLILIAKDQEPDLLHLVYGYVDDTAIQLEYNQETLKGFCPFCSRRGCVFQPRPLCQECESEAVMMKRDPHHHFIRMGTKGTFGDLMNVRGQCMVPDCKHDGLCKVGFVCKGPISEGKQERCPSRSSTSNKFQCVYHGLGNSDMFDTLSELWGRC
eukprot:gb/GECG01000929.1/.p1 GENE.gb/GECG01000929.1/~~gb/GECG01000929.1/.p1  ORF type:complete len:415 (+),score=43.55 gb/GECG01000929.1/:1-1245(+)